jgi:chaperone required for assembly of F1-ATPase
MRLLTVALGFERAVIASKSFILGLQVILGEQKLEEICQASQVELKYQQDFWGEVEDGKFILIIIC